jgi:hypothetical protein
MRFSSLAIASLVLAGCSMFSSAPADSSRLTLNDPYWERVNVELVITRRGDCDSRAEGYLSTRQVVMRKNKSETIDVPNGASLCWRHDRNPDNPTAGAWSGWTRATLVPGKSAEADL